MLKYLSPRTTRPRTLPLVWPGRPCSWPPSEPPNSRAARLRENFGGLTSWPGGWARERTASTLALLLRGDDRNQTGHASSPYPEDCAAAISAPICCARPTLHATMPARSTSASPCTQYATLQYETCSVGTLRQQARLLEKFRGPGSNQSRSRSGAAKVTVGAVGTRRVMATARRPRPPAGTCM